MSMDKRDFAWFIVLLALLFAWPVIDRMIARTFFSDHPAKEKTTKPAVSADEVKHAEAADETPAWESRPDTESRGNLEASDDTGADHEPPPTVTLTNAKAEFVLSSRGASLLKVTLHEYRASIEKDSGPMVLDFSTRPSLSYDKLPSLGTTALFTAAVSSDGRSVTFTRDTSNGLRLERTIEVTDRYVLRVIDRFLNVSKSPLKIPNSILRTGPMSREAGRTDSPGVISLGVDTLSPGGESVKHWGGEIGDLFEASMERRELSGLPMVIDEPPRDHPVDWVAAKNKYFVQILTPPEGTGERAWLYARRAPAQREKEDPSFLSRKMTSILEVGAGVEFASVELPPGQVHERVSTLYVGPMKYSELHAMRLHQVDVMEFGMWAPIGKLLLRVLNFLHDHIPPHNYGVAIILLTLIVRVVFWPITHKSTESMKRMAAVAPLVNEIREKYKDNPQKMQQEIMALYKEHKINPLGGCLPMLIQIPVFIALFVVLRSAIELRFASFLWIRDLSEPENLLPGILPFGLPLNILPLLMAATMYLQMKLSPSAGDPVQQKIMSIMMPAMMLIFLYNFASGLALYWTTQNVLMIIQQLMMKRSITPLAPASKGRK
ncbi:MAG: membrane protein insertase YidC [Kiritimatiellae bacterium]|nr:membrane protein insertase YidC [Kiritimatiellia bacterium]MDW8459179.1 membrane protein insertase YidC [Verrucomicrobiota bacterium]